MKKVYRLAALLLAGLFAFGGVPLFVSGDRASYGYPAAEAGEALDASGKGDDAATVIPAVEFFESACGVTLLESEKNYIRGAGMTFRYSSAIPSDRLTCTHLEKGLRVEAKEYSYTSSSGVEVRWIPVSATLDGKTLVFDRSPYVVTFEGIAGGVTYEVEVGYTTTFEIAQSALSTAVNAAYRAGRTAADKLSAYDAALTAYNGKVEEYSRIYEEFLAASNAYAAYLSRKEQYDRDKAAYDRYVEQKTAYEEQSARYAEYLKAASEYGDACARYEEAAETYRAAYAEYLVNAAQVKECRDTLATMATVFVKDEAGNMMYNTLLGPTVDTVMKNQGKLERQGGVDPNDVQGAGAATDVLRALLPAYRTLKKTGEKFAYYTEHYVEIRDSFIKLFKHLNNLCKNAVVREVLAKEGKLDRYYQFVAHLYVLAACFDDNAVYDPAWTVRGKTLQSLLCDAYLIDDLNNADPAGKTCPATEMKEPDEPIPPTPPEPVSEPVKTWEVDLIEPTAPKEVTAPEDPGALDAFAGVKPAEPVLGAEEAALAADYQDGALKQHDVTSLRLTYSSVITKNVAYEGAVTVRFFDADRRTLLYIATVLKGSDVSYGGVSPTKPSDGRYAYAFEGFFDGEGKSVSLSGVAADVDLYARYAAKEIDYSVIFTVRGHEFPQTCHWGDLPQPPAYETTYTEDGVTYVFSGFEPALTVVSGDARYTALYTAVVPERYTVVFEAEGVRTAQTVEAGQTPVPPRVRQSYRDETYVYTFDAWSPSILPADADADYIALYRKEPIVPDLDGGAGARVAAGVEGLTVLTGGSGHTFDVRRVFAESAEAGQSLTFSAEGVSVFLPAQTVALLAPSAARATLRPTQRGLYFELKDGDDGEIPAFKGARIVIGLPVRLDGECRLEYLFGDLTETPEFTLSDGKIELAAPGSGEYCIDAPHTVTLADGKATVNLTVAYAGDRITVTPKDGQNGSITSLELTVDGQGAPRVVLGSSFDMPDANVTIRPNFANAEVLFTVRFLDENGEVLHTASYTGGQTLTLPEAPADKPADDPKYLMSFSGWSPAAIAGSKVMGDAEYRAVYKKVKNAEYVSPYDSDRFISNVLLLQILPIFVLLVLLVSGPIVYRSFLKKKKK